MKLKIYLYISIPFFGNNNYVFCQVRKGEASSTAHFSFTYFYPLPDNGQMNSQNMSWKITLNGHTVFGYCVCVDLIAND
jgi:hypothetical protein